MSFTFREVSIALFLSCHTLSGVIPEAPKHVQLFSLDSLIFEYKRYSFRNRMNPHISLLRRASAGRVTANLSPGDGRHENLESEGLNWQSRSDDAIHLLPCKNNATVPFELPWWCRRTGCGRLVLDSSERTKPVKSVSLNSSHPVSLSLPFSRSKVHWGTHWALTLRHRGGQASYGGFLYPWLFVAEIEPFSRWFKAPPLRARDPVFRFALVVWFFAKEGCVFPCGGKKRADDAPLHSQVPPSEWGATSRFCQGSWLVTCLPAYSSFGPCVCCAASPVLEAPLPLPLPALARMTVLLLLLLLLHAVFVLYRVVILTAVLCSRGGRPSRQAALPFEGRLGLSLSEPATVEEKLEPRTCCFPAQSLCYLSPPFIPLWFDASSSSFQQSMARALEKTS